MVAGYAEIKRQQLLREAEGYLDLATACAEDLTLCPQMRNQLGERSVNLLARVGEDCEDRCYLLGMAFRLLERHHEAIEALEESAELNPDNYHTWLALGWCHKRVGRLDLAIQSLEEALSIAPDEAIIYYNLACYWSLASNVNLALAYLTRSFDIDPMFRDHVHDESDFDPIRNDPGFLELTSVIV